MFPRVRAPCSVPHFYSGFYVFQKMNRIIDEMEALLDRMSTAPKK